MRQDQIRSDQPVRITGTFALVLRLAWVRDDFMFAAATHSLEVASRMLVGFVVGTQECAICLEPYFDSPSVGLSCGHVLHTECLRRALGLPPPHTCPLCRRPFGVGADGTILDGPIDTARRPASVQHDGEEGQPATRTSTTSTAGQEGAGVSEAELRLEIDDAAAPSAASRMCGVHCCVIA